MATSIVDAESVLAVDIGSTHTRAMLFDVVDGQYRFIASGDAPSTGTAPYFDIGEGVVQAILRLQEVTGRQFLGSDLRMIVPTDPDGSGIDQLSLTYSAGPSLRVVTVGLLGDVSLQSARRLVSGLPAQIVEQIGINDRRRPETQIDAILQAKPDLIMITGGTENGATRSVFRQAELVSLALQILPRDQRPEVIFTGNQAISRHIQDLLEPLGDVNMAPNSRPSIDQEDIGPAQEALSKLLTKIQSRRMNGMQNYATLASSTPTPTSYAFGRIVRFLSQIYDKTKGVLGIDLGGNRTTIAAARQGNLFLNSIAAGAGAGAVNVIEPENLSEIMRWLPMHAQEELVRDYLYNKMLAPASVPMTDESLMIEHALTRQVIQSAVRSLINNWPDINPTFEPVIAGGNALTSGATPGQSLLMLLDGLQPVGVTTIVLDTYGLLPALGSLAESNTLLPVQVIESNAFSNLGTVIAPICTARYGTPVLNVRLEYEQGDEVQLEIKQGTLTALPLRAGQAARIHLQPLKAMQIDPLRKDRARSFRIVGGVCGAVIDMRGRPLNLPSDDARRRDMLKKWSSSLA